MSFKVVAVAPPNSVVLVMDPSTGEVPDTMGGQLVAATPSCVAVGTLSEHDGPTSLYLGSNDGAPAHTLAFEGAIATPNRELGICNIFCEPYLVVDVAEAKTKVQIWANHPSEPDDIRVVVLAELPKGSA